MKAAENVGGFSITVMPDLTAYQNVSVDQLAKATATLAASPASTRLADGRVLVSPFCPEMRDTAFWKSFMSTMKSTYGIDVALAPMFVNDATPLIPQYAPFSYAVTVWGVRNPAWNNPNDTGTGSSRGLAALARSNGVKWIQPVSVQDERPNQAVYDEAENTGNLRATWQLAELTQADAVHIPTWNDYSEGTQLAPSQYHGRAFLDLNAYFATKYKQNAAPQLVGDGVYLTHRRHPAAARPTFPETSLMTLRGGSPARDMVEAVTVLREPGQVNVTVGGKVTSCQAPAGLSVCVAPLAAGNVSAEVSRGGRTTVRTNSPVTVVTQPEVQDLQYVASSAVAR